MKMFRHIEKFDEINEEIIKTQLGVGKYQHVDKLYITHIEPNTSYELLDITKGYKTIRPSEDMINTLTKYLENIDIKRDNWYYDLLYHREFKKLNANVTISDNTVVIFSNEQDIKDDIYGSDIDNHASANDEMYGKYAVTYQYFSTIDKPLYIYSNDNVPLPLVKKCLFNPPKGLNNYICISKTYRLMPSLYDENSIKEFINHIIFNCRDIGDLTSEENTLLLRNIYNNIKQLGELNGYKKLDTLKVRLLTFISEDELRESYYRMYIKKHNIYITDDINLNYVNYTDEDNGQYAFSIKVITDENDSNKYYYNNNGKIIEIPKSIDNNKKSHIVIKENNNIKKIDINVTVNNQQVYNDELIKYHIYTNKYDAIETINNNKQKENEIKLKVMEMSMKENEIKQKDKEINLKDKEINYKNNKIDIDNSIQNKKIDVELETLKYKKMNIEKPIYKFFNETLKTITNVVTLVGSIVAIATASYKLFKLAK